MRWARRWTLLAVAALLLAAGGFAYPWLQQLRTQHNLVEFLGGSDPVQRVRAAIKLGAMRDERAVPVLIAALGEGDGPNPRAEEEVAALCQIGGARTVAALEAALAGQGDGHAHLLDALNCIDPAAARAALAKVLQGNDEALIRTLVMAQAGSRDAAIVGLLADAAGTNRKPIILAALTDAAGRPLGPRLTAILTAAAKDPDPAIRSAARASLTWNTLNAPGATGQWSPGAAPDDPETLTAAAKRASAFLAVRQDAAGFWRTVRTPAMRFEQQYPEKNTYLTPVIVDLLAPVANEAGLTAVLAKARRQITGEIEPGGLVRYYGPGTGPSAQQVCPILFDADDTALAWRVAPRADRAGLQDALATLRRFRTPEGLYRTWIGDGETRTCIDRGSDPNPADIGIQMHLLLFLTQASPAEGKALCAALGQAIGEDRIWVYYRHEPLIPLLREPDLASAGCPIRVPEARLRTDIVGQGKWLAAGRALAQGVKRDKAATLRLLELLARDDFAAIRRAPPLVYQNDATGKVPAFYWSQELGYALWLRLYVEAMRR